jgi:D-alanyl-D-alanine carboxypeptidase/D-alanyl-D-alanine-endopeptidase (penicillin-binding protein 4)
MRGGLFNGRVIAKSGSMKGVANLLGVVNSNQGDRLFVLILNGYNLPDSSAEGGQEKANKYLFQQAFFKTIMGAS